LCTARRGLRTELEGPTGRGNCVVILGVNYGSLPRQPPALAKWTLRVGDCTGGWYTGRWWFPDNGVGGMLQRRIARALSVAHVLLAVSSVPFAAFGAGGGNVGKDHQIIHVGGGQTIIAFTDIRNDDVRRVYAQKLDANGVAQWTPDGEEISNEFGITPKLVYDGAGGAIIVWQSQRRDMPMQVYAQRIDSTGSLLWEADGLRVCTAPSQQKDPDIATDDAGGAFVCWEDRRDYRYRLIYCQHIDSEGNRLWSESALPVSTFLLFEDSIYDPQVVPDGTGGASVAWMQERFVSIEFEYPNAYIDINAQRTSSAGTPAWNGGVEINVAAASLTCSACYADMELLRDVVPDGTGGFIVAWEGWIADRDAYVRQIDGSGVVGWTVDLNAAGGHQYGVVLQSDQVGGTFAAWVDERSGIPDVYLQRIDASGNVAWGAGGTAVASVAASRERPQIAFDAAGGVYVTWEAQGDVFAQRLDGSGAPVAGWPIGGLVVSNATGNQNEPKIAADGSSGAVVAWQDSREGNALGLFAQRLGASGAVVWSSDGIPIASAAGALAGRYVVTLGFDDLAPHQIAVAEDYASFGVFFQSFGIDGTPSFTTLTLPPFCGHKNWACFPAIGMSDLASTQWGGNFTLGVRYVNFVRPASHVHALVDSGQAAPISSQTRLNVWDSLNGGGTQVLPEVVVPSVVHHPVEFSTGQDNIASLTIKAVLNKAAFVELTFDSGTTPFGGSISVSSTIDSNSGPLLFLNGSPASFGNTQGTFSCIGACNACNQSSTGVRQLNSYSSPHQFLSLPVGKHVVTLYAPGYEWYQEYVDVWWGEEAQIDAVMVPVTVPLFQSAAALATSGGTIDVGDRAVADLVDFNNDGRKDLMVGNAAGDVFVFMNLGTDAIPSFDAGVTILSGVAANAAPIVLDYYADGLRDLLVGYADGTVRVYLNTGTIRSPSFEGTVYDTIVATIPTADAAPFMVDWDNDGKKDLLVGGADGNVYFFKNERLDASPAFSGTAARMATDAGSDDFGGGMALAHFTGSSSSAATIDATSGSTAAATIVATVSANAAPAAVLDWDGDGKKDLVVGDAAGQLQLFLNEGTDDTPVMGGAAALTFQSGSVIDVGSFARPIVGDFNNDFVKDIVVGNEAGEVVLISGARAGPVIPAMSAWGAAILALAVAAVGTIVMRARLSGQQSAVST